MREGWSLEPVSAVAQVVAGQSPKSEFYNSEGEGDPFYQGKKEFGDRFIGPPTKWTTSANRIAEAGDILMSVRAPVGPVNITQQRICIGRGLAAIRPGPRVDRDFLYYALLERQSEIRGTEGAVFASINKTQIGAVKIPLPPLAEQKRIVAILDEAFEALERAEECHGEAITQANLFTERFADQLLREVHSGSEHRSMADWGLKVSTGPFGSLLHKSDYIKGGVPLINPVNLVNGEIEVDAAKTVAGDALERLQRYRLNAGDVLVARRGEIGRCAPVTSEADGWLCGTGCFVIRASNNADSRYLAWLVRAGPNHDTLIRASSRATMPSISNKDLAKLEISLPPLSEQHTIVERIDAAAAHARELRRVHERQIDSLQALRQACLASALDAELIAERAVDAEVIVA